MKINRTPPLQGPCPRDIDVQGFGTLDEIMFARKCSGFDLASEKLSVSPKYPLDLVASFALQPLRCRSDHLIIIERRLHFQVPG